MAARKKPLEILEAFAEACTDAANALSSQGGLRWEQRDKFVYFHCPLPGLRDAHTWHGGPRASAWLSNGEVVAVCEKCVGVKRDYGTLEAYETAREAYTEQVKRAIRWSQDGVIHANFEYDVLRSHDYVDRDFRQVIRRLKIRYKDGRKEKANHNPWWWRVAPLSNGIPGAFQSMKAEEWLARNYPEHDKIYDALCWYGLQDFIDGANSKVVTAGAAEYLPGTRVLTEGEKDADSFNSLMIAAEVTDKIATCLCSPKPLKLASHHARLLLGNDVVIIGDADEPGRQHAENWTSLVWGHARSVKLVRDQLGLPGTPESKDLTDWIVAKIGLPPPGRELQDWIKTQPYSKQVAEELLAIIAAAAPLIEPIGNPTEWRTGMLLNQKGSPKADSPHNATRVWTMHPSLKGRVRTNLRSGEVEVIDTPWNERVTTGAWDAAHACSEWLERTERLSLSLRALEDALRQNSTAPPYNPLGEALATAWDGTPRIDALFTRYLPLDVEPTAAVALARIMIGDLVMKLRGEPHAQRVLVGIGTSLPLDVTGALLGRFGMSHQGRLSSRNLEQYARHEVGALQISMEPVGNRQAALVSIPEIFAPHVMIKQRLLSTPLVIAVGDLPEDPRTKGKVDQRCYLLKLAGEPKLRALAQDSDQILAEGVSQLRALLDVELPHGVMTIEEQRAFESAERVLRGIWVYATREIDESQFSTPRAMQSGTPRAEPRYHIVREQFLEVMRLWMMDHYRDGQAQIAAFNEACRAMGWVKRGQSPTVSITNSVAGKLRFDIAGKGKAHVPGILLTDERLQELSDRLYQPENSRGLTNSRTDPVAPEPAESLGSRGPVEAYVHREAKLDRIATPRAHDAYIYKKGIPDPAPARRWLEGEAAINRARLILSIPGVCGIDFETYPTAPKWHGDQAAARAKLNKERVGAARARAEREAELGGRAHTRQACTLQLCHENGEEVFIRLADTPDELKRIFDGCQATLVAHNAQFECECLLKHGVAVDIEDTLLAAKCLYLTAMPPEEPQPQSFSLAALVKEDLLLTRDKTIRDRNWSLLESLDDEAVEYGLQDARDVVDLWYFYRGQLEKDGLWKGYEIIARAILPTAAINLEGLTLDTAAHQALIERMRAQAEAMRQELDKLCNGEIANHSSSQQISDWVTDVVLGDTAKGEDAEKRVDAFNGRYHARTDRKSWKRTKTDQLALTKGSKARQAERLQHIWPQISAYLLAHLRWNKAQKLLVAFGDKLREFQDSDGRVRGQMRLGGTVTLRHSCEDPNLQNQPAEKDFRALWIAPPGRKLVIADYSQIELRLLAIVAKDERLQEVYREGRDVHQETADIAGIPRKNAKNVNFSMAYGAGAVGMAEQFGFTLDHAQMIIARVLGAYTGLAAYRLRAAEEAEKQGYIAIRPNRRVKYEKGKSIGTTAINYPIQGGAASVQMRALRLVWDALQEQPELDTALAASVHDEIILEAPDDERAEQAKGLLVDCMAKALLEIFEEAEPMGVARLATPQVCGSWAEKE